jgi:general stress protein YciG
MAEKGRRGFASMDIEKQRAIASKGGKAAHQKGTAHEFTPEEARAAGRKGGEAVSRNRQHMSEIGRRGGEAVSRDRGHMSTIGREGGQSSHGRRPQDTPNNNPAVNGGPACNPAPVTAEVLPHHQEPLHFQEPQPQQM